MNAQITRKSGTMCVSWGRSLLLSHCNFSLLNGSALRLSRGTATSTTRSIIQLSFTYQYTSVTHDAVMPYVCLQHVITVCFYCTQPPWFVRSVCHSHRKCSSVFRQPFGNLVGFEKIVADPYLKSWGLEECYKFRKPIVFCWRFGRKRPLYVWQYSSSSNDFQEWLRLTT